MKLVTYNIQYGLGADGRYDLARHRPRDRRGGHHRPAGGRPILAAFRHGRQPAGTGGRAGRSSLGLCAQPGYGRVLPGRRRPPGLPAPPIRHHGAVALADPVDPQPAAAEMGRRRPAFGPAGGVGGGGGTGRPTLARLQHPSLPSLSRIAPAAGRDGDGFLGRGAGGGGRLVRRPFRSLGRLVGGGGPADAARRSVDGRSEFPAAGSGNTTG